jgi:glycosyltransferase involved in cell wall biosynthesis
LGGEFVELLGEVDDNELWKLYSHAKGFIALAKDEDFGITPVESMAAGTPVIAYNGGGFKETVIDGITGIVIEGVDEKSIENAIKKLSKIKWDKKKILNQAMKFSKEVFVKNIRDEVKKIVR